MIPYRGRLSLRIARTALALACLGWYGITAGLHVNWLTALLTAYAVYSLGALAEVRFDATMRSPPLACWPTPLYFGIVDLAGAGRVDAVDGRGLSAGFRRASCRILAAPARWPLWRCCWRCCCLRRPRPRLVWTVGAAERGRGGFRFISAIWTSACPPLLRNNLIIRSQAEGAREAERQRIAADFHDGPLAELHQLPNAAGDYQETDGSRWARAADELRQLQDLCRGQVADLRSFVRSMRPADEGMSLSASLNRMVDSFQRDAGISATFTAS